MSHFTRVRTQLRNLHILQTALEDLKFEVVPQSVIRGYNGNAAQADLVVRMPGQYDVGFRQQDSGEVEMVADFWGLKVNRTEFLNQVTQRYAYHTVVEQAEAQGFQVVTEQNEQDGSIRLVVQRW